MAKNTSTKIKELKGIKPEKITDEQLKEVQETVNSLNKSQLEIGGIELRKHDLLHTIVAMRETLTELQLTFEKEYGTFDINITDGVINYPQDVEVNKKD
jgi:transposase